tara:strand:+ start:1889 stop:3019 length:1131 start_codon:yes stop_codon:yes gene_type:complete
MGIKRQREQVPSGPFDLSKTGYDENYEELMPGESVAKKTRTAGLDLSISPIETSKDDIDQPALAKDKKMYIPPLGSSVIISGKSGSGKSTLLANLLKDHRFYGPSKQKPKGWFDKIFLFSPTANGDDIQKSLNIPKAHVFTDLDEAADLLDVILDSQQKKLDDSKGADKVGQFCIIFDDVIGDTKFMNQKAFTRCFYQVRHVNCTTFICTQHFKRVPKVCRLQANFVFFFAGSLAEVTMITEEYSPPMVSKNDFMTMVHGATSPDAQNKFPFLTINNKVATEIRFRRNLGEILTLPSSKKSGRVDGTSGVKLEPRKRYVLESNKREPVQVEPPVPPVKQALPVTPVRPVNPAPPVRPVNPAPPVTPKTPAVKVKKE